MKYHNLHNLTHIMTNLLQVSTGFHPVLYLFVHHWGGRQIRTSNHPKNQLPRHHPPRGSSVRVWNPDASDGDDGVPPRGASETEEVLTRVAMAA